ncbi:polysaccharide lyase family 8 super-sandwich domain-containing protein [Flavivirga sp. 57AJ16]|uniref:polysaccharide lyase family 8 super-sandwich domain-containing protein n=1 Tax=Flavivirga sp. 57AJ16 TaxID=3025307 RepID=UPI002366C0B3|nr:polysaccharide lyase family 8 super-sandwich domain-containing protein [Flavivirga sp. 57AJ16]MDD7887839.1 polysaccharide lyase family 8 super-sandwich domain-containing protein [Flavivirga sp. 57AJ16]
MKNLYVLVLLFLLVVNTVFSQVNISSGVWEPIGDVVLSNVNDDDHNGDGLGDGALLVDGQSAVVGQGVAYTLGGRMELSESINISTYTYNRNSSFVSFKIELYNKTDNAVIGNSSIVEHYGNDATPVNTLLYYTAASSDEGDELQIRYIRTDNGHIARDFAIDNLTFTTPLVIASCPFTVIPDLDLEPSNGGIEAEIAGAVDKFSDAYLGTSFSGALTAANASYNALGITVNSGVISSTTPITNFNQVDFLKKYAEYLKFNPTDTDIKEKANNIVWLTSQYFCNGTLALDSQLYDYQKFARPASLLKDFLEPGVQDLFAYTLYKHSVQFEHFWEPSYDVAYQENFGAINTDVIYNISDVMLAYSLWHNTADERYRYMRGFKRYLNRFFSYTAGTTDGIKPDGTGFHHWTAYNNYMYSYNTAASLLSYLSGTGFQVDQVNYMVFRNAFYTQYMQANDAGVQALCTAGRNPQNRMRPLTQSALKTLAIAGGGILGLSTADPVLAGLYNRVYGVDMDFNYNTVTPFSEGFFQFNHASASVFRKDNWLVFNKGFSSNMWGSEIYVQQNRYGRYQGYGAQEIIYPGNMEIGNGYDVNTWDWNFNPGTTVIKKSWEDLHAERGRIDELQQKRFVGSLNFKNNNSELLTNNHGLYGMFAMDFQEKENQGFGETHHSENHNNSFTFKKSNFYFDDIIVCLGSGISNNDTSNETITTLFQRLDNTGSDVNVNGTSQSGMGIMSYNSGSANWLLSNYGTGFYFISGNDELVVKKEVQQNPNQNQIWPVDFSGNPVDTYCIGYLNHGSSPSDASYEYILMPDSNISEMQLLDTAIQNTNKPYTVYQQDNNAHIVEQISKKLWGYAFFNGVSGLAYDKVTGVDASCLVMTAYDEVEKELRVSIDYPDLGFESRSYTSSIEVKRQLTLLGEWALSSTYSGVEIVSTNSTQTVIEFTLVNGLTKEVLLKEVGLLSNRDFEKAPIAIYPNPTNNLLNIAVSSSDIQIKNIDIIDISGKTIYTQKSAKPIYVNHFAKGFYILNIEMINGIVVNKKIVIN